VADVRTGNWPPGVRTGNWPPGGSKYRLNCLAVTAQAEVADREEADELTDRKGASAETIGLTIDRRCGLTPGAGAREADLLIAPRWLKATWRRQLPCN